MGLAIVRDYSELHAALRARAEQLNVSRETIDNVAGFQQGYASKLLAGKPITIIGKWSFGTILAALGVKLILVEDPDAMARIKDRLVPRANSFVRKGVTYTPKDFKKWGAEGGKNGGLGKTKLSARERSLIALRAVRARWSRRSVST